MSTTDYKETELHQPVVHASNVWIMDYSFYIPQLNRYRRIWIYLPADYASSGKDYPVLYMQDGQNLFEEWSAFGEEWGVDESLNKLQGQCIVVGIDNAGEKRLNEYTIEDHPRVGVPEGTCYLEFLVETLKPYIDICFRTKSGREFTFIAGSSMGALISFYGCLLYPEIFSGAGVFSPAFWIAPNLVKEIEKQLASSKLPQRFYFYYGGKEYDNMEMVIEPVVKLLTQNKHVSVTSKVKDEGTHSEAEWRDQFPEFYNWLIQSRQANSPKLPGTKKKAGKA